MTYPVYPKLAMDGVFCDRPQDGCFISGKRVFAKDGVTSNKETSKMKYMAAHETEIYTRLARKNRAAADQYFATCMGQDAAMDDETVEKLKGFLKNKLSAEDHEQVCNMLAGDVDAAEDDTEQGGTPLQLAKARDKLPSVKVGGAAADAQADFLRRYPDLAKIRIDNSGIQPKRAASHSAADAKSFYERYPGLAHIRQL